METYVVVLAGLLPALVLLASEAAGRLGWVSSNLLPTPTDVVRALVDLGGRTAVDPVDAVASCRGRFHQSLGDRVAMADDGSLRHQQAEHAIADQAVGIEQARHRLEAFAAGIDAGVVNAGMQAVEELVERAADEG